MYIFFLQEFFSITLLKREHFQIYALVSKEYSSHLRSEDKKS